MLTVGEKQFFWHHVCQKFENSDRYKHFYNVKNVTTAVMLVWMLVSKDFKTSMAGPRYIQDFICFDQINIICYKINKLTLHFPSSTDHYSKILKL